MPTPEQSRPDRQDPYALRPLSRRTLLQGLAGIGGLTVASRLLGPGLAYADVTGYVGPSVLGTDINPAPAALADAVEDVGRLLHGVWLPGGPASTLTDNPPALQTYTQTGSGAVGAGHRPAIINYFRSWSQGLTDVRNSTSPFPKDRMQAITNAGAVPMLTWEPWDPSQGKSQLTYKLTELTGNNTTVAGTMDAMITAFAKGCADWGKPVILRLAHEMNSRTYPWCPTNSSNDGSGSDYPAFWKHVHKLFDDVGASNVMWAWVPNIDYNGSTPIDGGTQYPGHQWVDWVGLDGYNGYPCYQASWTDYPNLYDLSIDKLFRVTQYCKPVMIAENGCTDPSVEYTYTGTDSAGNKTSMYRAAEPASTLSKSRWFIDFFAYAADDSRRAGATPLRSRSTARGSRNLRAVCHFNDSGGTTAANPPKAGNWALTPTASSSTSDYAYVGYQQGLSTSALGHGWEDGKTPSNPAVLLLQDFFDDFSQATFSTSNWQTPASTVTRRGSSTSGYYASLSCKPATEYTVLLSANRYRLTGGGVYFKLLQLPYSTSWFRLIAEATPGGGGNELNFSWTKDTSSGKVAVACQYIRNGTTVTAPAPPDFINGGGGATPTSPLLVTGVGGGTPTPDFTWWRIHEAAGFIFWETCPDVNVPKPQWKTQARVYNLLRASTFQVQFKTGMPAGTTVPNTPVFLDVASFNTGRYRWSPPS